MADNTFKDYEHLHGKAAADDARWNTGLSGGNITDTKGNVRPNRMLRERLNRGWGVAGSDQYEHNKAIATTGEDPEDD